MAGDELDLRASRAAIFGQLVDLGVSVALEDLDVAPLSEVQLVALSHLVRRAAEAVLALAIDPRVPVEEVRAAMTRAGTAARLWACGPATRGAGRHRQ